MTDMAIDSNVNLNFNYPTKEIIWNIITKYRGCIFCGKSTDRNNSINPLEILLNYMYPQLRTNYRKYVNFNYNKKEISLEEYLNINSNENFQKPTAIELFKKMMFENEKFYLGCSHNVGADCSHNLEFVLNAYNDIEYNLKYINNCIARFPDITKSEKDLLYQKAFCYGKITESLLLELNYRRRPNKFVIETVSPKKYNNNHKKYTNFAMDQEIHNRNKKMEKYAQLKQRNRR